MMNVLGISGLSDDVTKSFFTTGKKKEYSRSG